MVVFFSSMKPIEETSVYRDCTNEAFNAMDEMLDWGYSVGQASCMGNAVYAACEGWPVIIEMPEECFD